MPFSKHMEKVFADAYKTILNNCAVMVFLRSLKFGHFAPFQKFIKETGAKKVHKMQTKLVVFGPTRFKLK